MLRGSLELILAGSRAREKPALRCEETLLRREMLAAAEGEAKGDNGVKRGTPRGLEKSGMDLSLERVLFG